MRRQPAWCARIGLAGKRFIRAVAHFDGDLMAHEKNGSDPRGTGGIVIVELNCSIGNVSLNLEID
jgi:hypothetical protein